MPRWLRSVLTRTRELCPGAQGPLHAEGSSRASRSAVRSRRTRRMRRSGEPFGRGFRHRLSSPATDEWAYVFKPKLAGMVLYRKLILRSDCVVISFHEDEGKGHE